MNDERTRALQALLSETGDAHGAYETAELGGVYDEAWPQWYAAYAVEHGIGRILGRDIGVDELAELLTTSWRESQAAGGSSGTWAADTARRIAGST
jgi:hypothetical protein